MSPGTVRSVVYAGSVTRYLVELEQGGEITVVRQNDSAPRDDVADGQASPSPGGPRTPLQSKAGERRRRMRRVKVRHVALALVAVALAAPAAGTTKATANEGTLNMIAWEGYLDAKWVKPFVSADRLQGERQVRRLVGRDGHADALGRRRPVRHGLRVR